MFRRRKTSAQRGRAARSAHSKIRFESLEPRHLLAGVNAPVVLNTGETARFDFGPAGAAVAANMTEVTPADQLTDATDFGFVTNAANLKGIERVGVWGDHSRDFVRGDAISFAMRVDPQLPHELTIGLGDPFRRRQVQLSIEGTVVGTFDIPSGQLQLANYTIDPSNDGLLEITVRTTGRRAAVLNHLTVMAGSSTAGSDPNNGGGDPGGGGSDPNQGGGSGTTDPGAGTGAATSLPTTQRLDFGTPTSSVHPTMTRVTDSDRFASTHEFGFLTQGSVNLASRSRNGYWGDHSRDYVMGDVIAFAMRLDPSQSYTLNFGFGDVLGNSRTQSISIEGIVVDQLSIPARRFVTAEYETVVSADGILEIVIHPTSSPAALINFVTAIPLVDQGGGTDPPDDPPPSNPPPSNPPPSSHRLDFGTVTSAVKDAMLRVTEMDRFGADRDFGFVTQSSTNLSSRSRDGLWGDHSRDFVRGDIITLAMRLDPSLFYSISFGFGDATGSDRAQSVAIEGTVVDQLSVPGGHLVLGNYGTAISSDGVLDITIRSTTTRSALVNYVIVVPTSPPISSPDVCETGADHTSSTSNTGPAWLDLFPSSTAPTFDVGSQPITCSQRFTPGTNWNGLDERQVFASRLTVTDSNQQPTHEYRIGQGSQLYSLRTRDHSGQWHEVVGSQRPGDAEWVDEVIQSVLVDTQLNDRSSDSTKNQIHQAGTYRRNVPEPTFYSPVLAESWQESERSYSTISWPQQAHIPSNFKSHFLQMQKVRDLGNGVLEVTYVYQNFSQEGEKVDFLAAPWLPVRNSEYPFQFLSLPDGTIRRDQRQWCVGCSTGVEPIDSTGGYFLFSSGTSADDQAFAIVFGNDSDNDGQRARSRFRWGTVTVGNRDLTASSLQKLVNIDPGEVFYTRFFLVANSLRETRVMSSQLVDHVSQGFLDAELSSTVNACLVFENDQISTDLCSSANSIATVSTTPRAGWQPLMVLREAATGNRLVTNDPYQLMRRPYLREFEVDEILGWASPATMVDLAMISDPEIASQLVLV